MAIDKKMLTQGVLKNGSSPAESFVPPSIKGSQPKELEPFCFKYHPQVAKKLWINGLKEVGIKTPNIELIGTDDSKQVLEYLSEQFRKHLGITIKITPLPLKQRIQRGRKGEFDLILSGWGADYNDPMTFLDLFQSTNGFNRGRWHNKHYDFLIKRSKRNGNFEKRIEDLHKAEKILLTEAGIIPLYWRSRLGLRKGYVKNLTWHHIGPETLKWAYIER